MGALRIPDPVRAPVFPSPSSTQRRRRRAKTTTAKARDAFRSFPILFWAHHHRLSTRWSDRFRKSFIDRDKNAIASSFQNTLARAFEKRTRKRKKNEEEEEKKEARKQKRTVWRRLSSARSRGRIGRQQFGSRRTLLLVLCLCVYLKVRTSLHVTPFLCFFFG